MFCTVRQQTARNDVKRYAIYALRLHGSGEAEGTEHDAWGRKINQLVQNEAAAAKENDLTIDNHKEESVEKTMQSLAPFLTQQKRLIQETERENAKLSDMLRSRPTQRELVTSQLEESGIIERVGLICFDIVASCCYVLEVEDVGELPSCVEKARQLSQVSTTYQEFVERIEKLLKQLDKDAFYATRAADTSCHEALEMILSHVKDVLVELDARREQMKPPGSKVHEVLLANTKLL
ncbi:hypothetical protein GN244_ATG00840 [Phytophthora infestans]|uniref:Uncharacterized protein n=1 Tax=Phytophthora infestans TaxID=4787 RepID=A0A833TM63_PHYIN|nr:hypothetical protein GN244_ATG00840 [Phytophthora infestans]